MTGDGDAAYPASLVELTRFYAATFARQAAALARVVQESGAVLTAFDESML